MATVSEKGKMDESQGTMELGKSHVHLEECEPDLVVDATEERKLVRKVDLQ
jgi:hypothetical protein